MMSGEGIELPKEEVAGSASMKCLPNEIEAIEERQQESNNKKGAIIPRQRAKTCERRPPPSKLQRASQHFEMD